VAVSQSAGDVSFAVTLDGVDKVEGGLKRVERAAEQTGRAAEKSGGLFGKFESATRKLDDAVDSVEKPMRALNGALDIASVALGVGLAGPLGTVIGQLIDFGKIALDAAAASDTFANRAATLRTTLESIGKAARSSEDDVKALYAAIGAGPGGAGTSSGRRVQVEQAGLQIGAIQTDIEALQADLRSLIAQREEVPQRLAIARADVADFGRVRALAQSSSKSTRAIVEGLQSDIATLEASIPDIAAKIAGTTSTLEARERALQKARDDARKSLGLKTEAEEKAARATTATTTATQAATVASVSRTKAVTAETSSLEGLRKALAAIDPLVARAGAEARASRLSRGVEAGTVGVTDGLFPSQSRSVQGVLGMGADDLAEEFDAIDRVLAERQTQNAQRAQQGLDTARLANDLAGNGAAQFDNLTKSAMDLGSMGVSALQSFTQAAGASLASLIIDGGKAGKSFSKLAGEVAAGLSAQAFAYSLFLGAAAAISAVTGGVVLPGWNPVQLGTAAAIMGGVGVALAGTARALGAGSAGRAGSTGSASAASGGGGDRVASLSGSRAASQPTQVTVILGVDEVSSVLVRQTQRDARAGGLTSGRLAVA